MSLILGLILIFSKTDLTRVHFMGFLHFVIAVPLLGLKYNTICYLVFSYSKELTCRYPCVCLQVYSGVHMGHAAGMPSRDTHPLLDEDASTDRTLETKYVHSPPKDKAGTVQPILL